MDQLLWERVQVVVSWERVKVILFFPSLHSITMVLTWWLRLELSEMGSNYVLIRASKWMTSNLIPKLWWTPSLVLYPPLDMCFTWSENASAYCLLAWWFLTSIDKATQLQTDWLLMLTLTGLIASLKLLLLSCKQAYYNDKEGLYLFPECFKESIKTTCITGSSRESYLDPAKKRNFDSSRFNLFGGCPSPEALVEPKVLVGSLLSLLFHDLRI